MEHIAQIKNLILDPTLKLVKLYSPEASDLVLGTGLVESNFSYIKQLGNGPALGPFQMEPPTFDDTYYRYLDRHPELRIILRQFEFKGSLIPIVDQLMMNLPFAIIMARIKYLMVPAPIPKTADGQAQYWKDYYNTAGGKGEITEYLRKWRAWRSYADSQ